MLTEAVHGGKHERYTNTNEYLTFDLGFSGDVSSLESFPLVTTIPLSSAVLFVGDGVFLCCISSYRVASCRDCDIALSSLCFARFELWDFESITGFLYKSRPLRHCSLTSYVSQFSLIVWKWGCFCGSIWQAHNRRFCLLTRQIYQLFSSQRDPPLCHSVPLVYRWPSQVSLASKDSLLTEQFFLKQFNWLNLTWASAWCAFDLWHNRNVCYAHVACRLSLLCRSFGGFLLASAAYLRFVLIQYAPSKFIQNLVL